MKVHDIFARGLRTVERIGPRTAQASRLNGRVDLLFRLISDPDGQLVKLERVPFSSIEVVRNRPAECDTADVTLVSSALPFDLRVFAPQSVFVSIWLFEGDEPSVCVEGAPGHFFGVVDNLSRDRYEGSVKLAARDMTASPLQANLPEGFIKAFEARGLVSDVVLTLIREIPGTQKWSVVDLAGARPVPTEPLTKRPGAKGTKGKPSTPATRRRTRLSDFVGETQVSVWSAVTSVCARAGVVPEVRMGAGGSPEVVLVDAMELQRGDVLRPFERGGRRWRVFVDGEGIARLSERLEVSASSDRPDFVEVSTLSTGGKRLAARWPETPSAKDKRDERGLFQYVPSVESVEALRDMARSAFDSLRANQFFLTLEATEPWSAGGGPDDPDLLSLGFGALVEVSMRNLEAVGEDRTVEEVLEARGVAPGFARLLAAAHQRIGVLSLLFQVVEVRHQLSKGYRCVIELRQTFDGGR